MTLRQHIKSKKVLLGLGAAGVIAVGFLVFQAMAPGQTDPATPHQRSKPASQTATRRPSPTKSEEPTESPLFQAIQALRDPFREEDARQVELEEKLKLVNREVEYLKAELQEKQLRMEIAEIERSLAEADRTQTSGKDRAAKSLQPEGPEVPPEEEIQVRAVLMTDGQSSALIAYRGRKAWVKPGERLGAWRVESITDDGAVLSKEGRRFVFFCDRPQVTWQGEP